MENTNQNDVNATENIGVTEMQKIEWENNGTKNTLKIKNVGNRNPNAQIQMVFDRWDTQTERSKPLICIDIPADKVASFLEAIGVGN